MLVLSRKRGEWIRIGEDILITIVKITGRKAKIGILAPASVTVLRAELLDEPDVAREGGKGGFLVLTRGEGDAICLGHNITLKVISVRGSNVRLGLEAPENVRILRVSKAA